MKILITDNTIVSLENVRRIDFETSVSNHTSQGRKYSVNHYQVRIAYMNGEYEHLKAGEDEKGKIQSESWKKEIINILRET